MSYMARALALARRSLGSVSPNPSVGAVVVKDGDIVGEGRTQPSGQEHAETMALRQAGSAAAGAILYTTLEPCNHQGKTPPCTRAIAEARVAEVRVATLDPNPNVPGNGVAQLRADGVRISVGEGDGKARQLMEAYLKFVTTGLPFVTAKFAMSLDGKIATRTGDSRWVSGDRARWQIHRIRAVSDAIMVGINTVLADDPRLTARDERGEPRARQPLRVIVDSHGRAPAGARLMSEPGETLVVAAEIGERARRKLARSGAQVAELPSADGSVDLAGLMKMLAADRGITSVCVEGGSTLLGSLFDMGLVDKVVAFIAPTIIGGRDALTPVGGAGFERMVDTLKLERVRWDRYGRDMSITGYC